MLDPKIKLDKAWQISKYAEHTFGVPLPVNQVGVEVYPSRYGDVIFGIIPAIEAANTNILSALKPHILKKKEKKKNKLESLL